MVVKEVFDKAENGTLTYDQFMQLAGDSKFVDLSEGNYVSKGKFTDELETRDLQIKSLNDTLTARDNDLEELKSKLESAGTDAEKLNTLTNDFSALQSKYETDVKNYKAQLESQAYDFAVREYASKRNFSSEAARRDFIQSMKAENLKVKNGDIIGADDFATLWEKDNPDAFKPVENDVEDTGVPKPQFVSSTQGKQEQNDPTNGFASAFHFTTVRPIPVDGN